MNARPLALTTLFVLGAGCHLLGGPAYYVDDDEATSGAGGGSVASQTASSSSSNAMSSSASGDCNATTCQPIDSTNDCIYATCSLEGECLPAETKDTGKACGSAGSRVCNGKGVCVECLEDVDCKDSSAPYCAVDSGLCVACVDDTPCKIKSPDLECIQFTCVTELCKNTSQDMSNGESDIDCGGKCSPCAPGKKCVLASDCASKLCEGGICGCTESGQCPNGNYCDVPQKTCVPKKNNGASCTSPDQCKTETCSTSFTCWFEPCCH